MKVGDKLKINGVVYELIAIWAAGRHTRYMMADGKEFIDLHLHPEAFTIINDNFPLPEVISREKITTPKWKFRELPVNPPKKEFDDEA